MNMDRSETADLVIRHIHANARLPPGAEIDPSKSLLDHGINSMDAMEIVYSLARERRVRVSPVQVAKIQTIDQLIDMFGRVENKGDA